MLLVERKRTYSNIIVENMLDSIPLIGKLRKEKRDKKELQELLRGAVAKVLQDLQTGGFVQEIRTDDYEEDYWIALEGNNGLKYSASFYLASKKEKVEEFTLSIVDSDSLAVARWFHFLASSLDTSVNFFDADWTGGYLWTMEKMNRGKWWEKPSKLTVVESIAFLQEVISSEIDTETTQKEFDKAKRKEYFPDWLVFWAQNRRNQNQLPSTI